jgi:ribosome-binding protein aMBF1 (putative translation factor)
MICEICGKEFRGRGTEIYVDGAQLRVCPNSQRREKTISSKEKSKKTFKK